MMFSIFYGVILNRENMLLMLWSHDGVTHNLLPEGSMCQWNFFKTQGVFVSVFDMVGVLSLSFYCVSTYSHGTIM